MTQIVTNAVYLRIMFWKTVIFLFIASLILRFVLKYVLPIARITKGMRQQMSDLQNQVNQQAEQQKKNKRVDGDFIDYEEVK